MKLSIRERLLLTVHVDTAGCWLWQGLLFKNTGYGQITYSKKIYSTHRLSMHVFKAFDLNSDKLILHRCDVKSCINPEHLYVGDRLDNARDAAMRGQQPRGSLHANAKLNEVKVATILQMLRAGATPKALAAEFNVSDSTINLIKRRQTWTHVREADHAATERN